MVPFIPSINDFGKNEVIYPDKKSDSDAASSKTGKRITKWIYLK